MGKVKVKIYKIVFNSIIFALKTKNPDPLLNPGKNHFRMKKLCTNLRAIPKSNTKIENYLK